MFQYKHAFTLIELLVVVLIIGILVAVAVPQYQRAVEKSRVVEALNNLKTIGTANQIYYLNNGIYANTLSDLDISIENSVYFIYAGKEVGTGCIAVAQHKDSIYKLRYYSSGEIACFVLNNSEKGEKICQILSGNKKNESGNYMVR